MEFTFGMRRAREKLLLVDVDVDVDVDEDDDEAFGSMMMHIICFDEFRFSLSARKPPRRSLDDATKKFVCNLQKMSNLQVDSTNSINIGFNLVKN
nr:hypothetical protein [Tanacetum cinerariifolium]